MKVYISSSGKNKGPIWWVIVAILNITLCCNVAHGSFWDVLNDIARAPAKAAHSVADAVSHVPKVVFTPVADIVETVAHESKVVVNVMDDAVKTAADGPNAIVSAVDDIVETVTDAVVDFVGDAIDDIIDFLPTPNLCRNNLAWQPSPDWMGNIDGNTYLHTISIPGTHDTMAIKGRPDSITSAIGRWVITQEWTLDMQLQAGIRYLDIRCRKHSNSFPIHHGPIFLNTFFETVLTTVVNFLNNHPSETVILQFSKEHDDVPGESFATIFNDYLRTYVPQKRKYMGSHIPQLKDVRGRIVFLNWDNIHGLDVGLQKSDTTTEERIRNDYAGKHVWTCNNFCDIDRTLKQIMGVGGNGIKRSYFNNIDKNIKRANEQRNERRLTITFASATNNDWIGCYGSIRYLAHHMNDHFNRKWYARGFNTGIVLFDFPSVATIRKIYETNPQFSGKFTFICKIVHHVI